MADKPRFRTLAEPPVRRERRKEDPLERMWKKSERRGTCWIWQGYLTPLGYGQMHFKGRTHLVHRVSYFLKHGPLPMDKELDHTCREHACWNPDHLEVVSHHENMRRSILAKRTHCPQGHEYTESNIMRHGRYGTGRGCRKCHNKRTGRKWKAKRAAYRAAKRLLNGRRLYHG